MLGRPQKPGNVAPQLRDQVQKSLGQAYTIRRELGDAYIRWAAFEDRWDGWQPLHTHPGWKGVMERIVAW
jgi:hypothetical protein